MQGVRFTCDGSITSINTSRDWYYPACTSCNLKLENNNGIYDCKVHGPIDYPTYGYNFKGYLTDDTATAMITFFTPRANQIVGVDCNSLLGYLQDPDPQNIPERIKSIVGKRHIFQFYYNTTSKQGPAEFIFATPLDQPDTAKQLSHIPSGSTPHEQATNIIQPPIPEQQVPTPVECSFSSTPAADIKEMAPTAVEQKHADQPVTPTIAYIGMQTRSRTEIMAESREGKEVIAETTELHTPPPSQDTINKPSSKTSGTETTKTTVPKRQLFQEKTPDPKKNKKD
ncbi:hypothetical protein CTI12_AA053860 [Artemisia annua]|uniref:Replication factor A C-terminal domain-containing protein n=1 Tax=Artemisia annua TaxID=35608 RepID=A0A2U1Q7K5_ARTAN|nr:hypothetical protein CTI12_AA053860 [Artemisia annua]